MVRPLPIVCLLCFATLAAETAGAQVAPPGPPGAASTTPAPLSPPRSAAASAVTPIIAPYIVKAEVAIPDGATTPTPAQIQQATSAAAQASDQLDKFQNIYDKATKIFGNEHTVISPTFYYATDLQGRLSTSDKHLAGVSGLLMLPLVGYGGNHQFDIWPRVITGDATQVYQAFLNQLDQFKQAEDNARALSGRIDAIAHTKWSVQNLLLAKQLFCNEQVDPELPPEAQAAIKKLCDGKIPLSINGTATADQQAVINVMSSPSSPDAIVTAPQRHSALLGPAIAIPMTKNPTDIFQYGAALEVGNETFRFILDGGLVGRYQGGTPKDIFEAGWFVGIALSGVIGDDVFHYFNGGSNLLAQLAQIKSTPGN